MMPHTCFSVVSPRLRIVFSCLYEQATSIGMDATATENCLVAATKCLTSIKDQTLLQKSKGSLSPLVTGDSLTGYAGSLSSLTLPSAIQCLVVILLGSMLVTKAQAQLLDHIINPNVTGTGDQPGVTVLTRPRPDYQTPEIRLGSLVVAGDENETIGYDDDVTGYKPFKGSWLVESSALLSAHTDWPSNAVFGAISVDDRRYLDLPQQSGTSWAANVGGTLNLDTDLLSATYYHDNLLLNSRDLDTPNLTSPLAIKTDDAVLLYKAVFSALTLQPAIEVTAYDFANANINGNPLIESLRNRDVYAPSITARYGLSPDRQWVFLAQESFGRYTNSPTPTLNYDDTTALVGYETTVGDLWRTVLLAGYEYRTFRSSAYSSIGAPIARLQVVWSPTGLTTVTGSLTRRIGDTATDFTASTATTEISLRLDHELLPNLLFHAVGGIDLSQYTGGLGHTILYTADVGITYNLNRYMSISAGYQLQRRAVDLDQSNPLSEGFGPSYVDNRYLLQLRFRL